MYMKKITQITLVCLTVSLAFLSSCKKDSTEPTPTPAAKTCTLKQMDLTVFGSTSNAVITTNTAGQVIESQSNDNGEISGTFYTYNSDGKMITMSEYSDMSKTIDSKTTFIYGNNGITEERYFSDNGNGLELESITRSEYTGTQLTRKNMFALVNGQEVSDGYTIYAYASNGDVNSMLTYSDDGNGGWKQSDRTTFTYNDKVANAYLLTIMTEDPNFPAKHYITQDKEESYNDITQAWEIDQNLDYVYTFNSDGYPSKIVAGQGLISILFTWDCK